MRAHAALPVLLVALALPAFALPATARAYDHQATLELGLGWAHAFDATAYDENGLAVVLGGSVGLGDTFALRGAITWAGHPGPSFAQVGQIGAEVVYLVDILEVVPFAGIGIDAMGTIAGSDARADFAVHAVGGVDWLFQRGMYVGIEARPFLALTALDAAPIHLTVTARFGLTFDL